MITIRFRNFPDEKSYLSFLELIELATGEKVFIEKNIMKNVDLEITGPYGDDSDSNRTPFIKKLKRLGYITFTNGRHLSRKDLAVGIQPSRKTNKNIWYTGENQRPPQGNWDGYLSFDTNLSSDRSVYFPLWFITSTDLFKSTAKSYWGGKVPTVNELLNGRKFQARKMKFASTFIGKSYPMRLHAIEALAQIGNIDIYGEAARNKKRNPSKIAGKYNYIMCFENDIYPGYVTEKPFEAYIAGGIPLYYGLDSSGFLNSGATLNLADFKDLSSWVNEVSELEHSNKLFKKIYEQPILLKKPTLDNAINLIRKILQENT